MKTVVTCRDSRLQLVVLILLVAVCSNCDACSIVKKIFRSKAYRANYKGCYVDRKSERDLKYLSESTNDMTLEKCNTQCKAVGAIYYGAQSGTDCYCGSEFGKHAKADDDNCDRVCAGNAEKSKIKTALLNPDKCGGDMFKSVYEVS